MRRIATGTKATDLWGAGKHGFTEGDPQASVPPTDLSGNWFNDVQEELANVLEKTGKALDATFRLFDAIFDGVRTWKPEYTLAGVSSFFRWRTHKNSDNSDNSGLVVVTVAKYQAASSTTHSIDSADLENGLVAGIARVSIVRDNSGTVHYWRQYEVVFDIDNGVSSGMTSNPLGTAIDTTGGVVTGVTFAGVAGTSKIRVNVTFGASPGNTWNVIVHYSLTRNYCTEDQS